MLRASATASLLFFVSVLAAPSSADARFFRSEHVPNGQKLDCSLCHLASNGDGPRNAFGSQIEAMGLDGEGMVQNQGVVWSQIYMLDADEDGFTNGYELGDPDGTWMTGDADPRLDPSLPGDPDSLPCPNGSVHPDEECDGEDLADATCQTLGFDDGTLACNADCTFDTSMCTTAADPDIGMPGMDGGIDGQPDDMGAAPPRPDTGMTATEDPKGDENTGGRYGPYFDNPPPDNPPRRGCAGSLDVQLLDADRQRDTGVDGSLLLLVVWLAGRGRRASGTWTSWTS